MTKKPEERVRQAEDKAPVDATRPSRVSAASPGEILRKLAAGAGIQALWSSVLPLVGVKPAAPDEFPGIFQVESGPGENEAVVHIDIPSAPYEPGEPPAMERVVTLSVKLDHDFRKLGDRYYCVDCEPAENETRH